MITYTVSQWILIFFIYCLVGWIWESCFVSVQQKKWVNRGFLKGPILPIYGFGALIILFVTLPVKENPVLIYIFGMLGATILEYFTGAAMEKLFHVRYWDYSHKRFNLNGHICLGCSLGWGVFSIALVKLIHPPVDNLVTVIPEAVTQIFAFIFVAFFAADTMKSVQEALDFKELLESLSKSSSTLSGVKTRIEHVTENISKSSSELQLKLEELEKSIKLSLETREQRKEEDKLDRRAAFEAMLNERRMKSSRLLDALNSRIDFAADEILLELQSCADDKEKTEHQNALKELEGYREMLRQTELAMAARKNRDYKLAVSVLERNPSASSKGHSEALNDLKKLISRKK